MIPRSFATRGYNRFYKSTESKVGSLKSMLNEVLEYSTMAFPTLPKEHQQERPFIALFSNVNSTMSHISVHPSVNSTENNSQ